MIEAKTELTLFEDRILLHGAQGVVELPLAYQIHSRLIQTGELARLLAERLRDDLAAHLPGTGRAVRLHVPLAWGLVCLRLPYVATGALRQPLHQLAWEIDTNAPEAVEQYLFDFVEGEDAQGAPETRLLAVRRNLLHFCRTLVDELGLSLVELAPAGEAGAGFRLQLARAADHQEAWARETYPPVTAWGRLALSAAAVLVVVATGLWWMGREAVPPADPPLALSPVPGGADSLRQALATVPTAVPDSTPRAAPAPEPGLEAWKRLLEDLAEDEERLPDWMSVDAGGILVRAGRGQAHLADLLKEPARATRTGRTGYWVRLDSLAAGASAAEDSSRGVLRFRLPALAELAPRLREVPARIQLQRIWEDEDRLQTRWRFPGDGEGASRGWWVTVIPARRP
jgi:hypothetical protein